MPIDRIEDWINPSSSPKALLQYALKDMVMEKVDSNDGQISLSF
jgi:hypothetical protein